jgi:hypothetical protein
MKITFKVKPGNKLGKRIERADKLERREQRRAKAATRHLFA